MVNGTTQKEQKKKRNRKKQLSEDNGISCFLRSRRKVKRTCCLKICTTILLLYNDKGRSDAGFNVSTNNVISARKCFPKKLKILLTYVTVFLIDRLFCACNYAWTYVCHRVVLELVEKLYFSLNWWAFLFSKKGKIGKKINHLKPF